MQKFLIVLFSLSILSGFAQSKAEKLFQTKKWSALVAMKAEAKKLSGKDIYRIGQGCMKEKQDTAAIRMFRMSIKKGYKTGDLYYNLGICYNQVERYPEAVYALNNALYLVPDRKIYLLEKGASFYSMNELDSALATYQYTQKAYPKNQFSAYMVCLVLHEQEKLNQCLKCYYGSLQKYKDNNKFYRMSLESIVRLEWHNNNRLDKAETGVKNLMAAYPNNYEYSMWLTQLYHQQNLFEKAKPVVLSINNAYSDQKLSNKYYEKGNFLVDAFDSEFYYMESYQWFRPEKNDTYYTIFIFSPLNHNPNGKFIVQKTSVGFTLLNQKSEDFIEVEKELTYENVKFSVVEFFHKRAANSDIDSNIRNND
jgi:tetratricopeptide (TPR) repeat protein